MLISFNELFKNGSTEWLAGLNDQPIQQQQLLVSFIDNSARPYGYPDADLCLFARFPHERQVFVQIQSSTHIYECTCTLVWLLKNWQSYTLFSLNNTSVWSCLQPDRFQLLLAKCNLDYQIQMCLSLPTTTTTEETTTTTTTPTTTTEEITTTTTSTTTTTTTIEETTEEINMEEPTPDFPFLYLIIGLLVLIIIILLVVFIIIYHKITRPRVDPVPVQSIPRFVDKVENIDLQTNYCRLIAHRIYSNKNQFRIFNNQIENKYMKNLNNTIDSLLSLNQVKLELNRKSENWLNPIYYVDDVSGFFVDFRNLNLCIGKIMP